MIDFLFEIECLICGGDFGDSRVEGNTMRSI
jgi:hypothetical protein